MNEAGKAIIEYLESMYSTPQGDTRVIKPEHSFTDDLGMDSLTQVEVVMGYEELFDCEVEDFMGLNWKTVQDAIDYAIKNNLKV